MFYNDNGVTVPPPVVPTEAPIIETASVYVNREYKDKAIAWISGSSLIVNYYNQIIGNEDVVTGNDDVSNGSLKQYRRITNYDLRVEDHNSHTYNPTDASSQITSSANVGPVFVPTAGDALTMMLEPGVWGICEVVEVEKMSAYKDSVHQIRYVVKSFTNSMTPDSLEDRTVIRLFFDMEAMQRGHPALYTESEKDRVIAKRERREEILHIYYSTYYDNERFTFLNTDRSYDHYVVDFFRNIVELDPLLGYDRPMAYDVRNATYKHPYKTIWDMILTQTPAMLRSIIVAVMQISTVKYSQAFMHTNVYGSKLRTIVVPLTNTDGIVKDTALIEAPGLPYVVSAAFYNGDVANLDEDETLLWRLLKKTEIINFNEVEELYVRVQSRPLSEQFHWLLIAYVMYGVCR